MSFKNIVGHEPVIRLLKGQLAKERLASSYLLSGPVGIGKRAVALELAKALECAESVQGESCDGCEACLKIGTGSFQDVVLAAPELEAGQMGIDQVRTLVNGMSLTSLSGRWKVGIVDQADRLTEEAAHAFLKFLEEPPERCLILLIAAAPQRLPQTLLSRCHQVRCVPQGIERVAAFLQEKEHLEKSQAIMLATLSGGRLGMALNLHREEGLAEKNQVLDQLLTARRQGLLEVPLGTAGRAKVGQGIEWVAAWWRDLVVLSLGGKPEWVLHQDRLKDLQNVIASEAKQSRLKTEIASAPSGLRNDSVEKLLNLVEKAYWAQETVERNASPRIALSVLLSQ